MVPLLAFFDPQWMFLLGVLVLAIVLMRRSYTFFRRRRKAGGASGPPAEARLQVAEPPAELQRWQVEVFETARDLSAQLDSKMSALQALIRSARRESERLEAAITLERDRGVDGRASRAEREPTQV